MATQTYRLEILSPTHIGSGQEHGAFDGVFQNGRWYLIDLRKVLERSKEDPTNLANAMMQQGFNWASWLQKRNISPAEVAAHSVACAQNPGATKIRACIRDPFGRPYIPGSTLKGAIRTAVLESLLTGESRQRRQQWARRAVQKNQQGKPPDRRYVARNTLERDLLIGKVSNRANESNYDLLRALHIGDSEPMDPEQAHIGLAWVHTLRNSQLVQKRAGGEEYKMFLEWLPTGVQTRLTIRIDERLLEGKYRQDVGFDDNQVQALREFANACNERARAVIEHEGEFYEDYGLPAIAKFYQMLDNQLQQIAKQRGFLLNIGWGGGWEMKTVTNPLTENLDEEYERIRQTYNLGRRGSDEFPKTRRVAYQGNQPFAPPGWVALVPEVKRP
jgi:CRISPR-associated protein Csm5